MPARATIQISSLLALIRERRDRSPDIGPRCAARCRLPTIRGADPKIYASNWTISYLTGCVACNAVVEEIAHDLQRMYRLDELQTGSIDAASGAMKPILLFHDGGLTPVTSAANLIGAFDSLTEAEQFTEQLERSEQGNWAQILHRDGRALLRSGRQEGAASGYWWTWQDP